MVDSDKSKRGVFLVSERYCFYCGSKLGLNEVCQCRQREQAYASYASTSSNTDTKSNRQTKENTTSNNANDKKPKAKAFSFKPYLQKLARLWQNFLAKLRNMLTILNLENLQRRISDIMHVCFFPASSYVTFTNIKPVSSFVLGLCNALLLALDCCLLLKNSTWGRIFSMYLTPISAQVTLNFGSLFFKISLIAYVLFLAKVLLYRFLFATWHNALSWRDSLCLINSGLIFNLLFTLLALCFTGASPIQFALIYCLGQCLVFLLEVKTVSSCNLSSEDRAITMLVLANFILIALTGFMMQLILPELVLFNVV